MYPDLFLKLTAFPILFGGAFIEAFFVVTGTGPALIFPFLFGRAFIEAMAQRVKLDGEMTISLPLGKGFH